jgi:hypothetical protein
MRAFAQADRFVSELEARKLRPPTCSWAMRPSSASAAATPSSTFGPADLRDFSLLSSILPKPIWRKFSIAPARLR